MALNLEKQLKFYGSYHHDPINIGIHTLGVPALLLTGLLLATNSPALPLPDAISIPNLPVNLGTSAALVYAGLYVLMEPIAGGLLAPLILSWTAYANHLTSAPNGSTINHWALGVHIASWLIQFIGHGVFEGRAPALLDNLVQAILLAPFFVWFEILFFFGYRPELKRRLGEAIEVEIARFKASKSGAKGLNGSAS